MFKRFLSLMAVTSFACAPLSASELTDAINADYDEYLWPLFDHFHRNPELSLIETETAKRMARELRHAGFDVTEGVGGTGVVAMLENGEGPLVMMRADMDGLPVEEKSGLENASRARQIDPITGNEVFVMHACGHDVHITSLVGAARQMAARKDDWSGTLMLVAQPAEERGLGARMMRDDDIWGRFGRPDYALALHVFSKAVAGNVYVANSPFAGVDSVDIIVHGIGGHGAAPHETRDPVVIGAQIVLALQTLVSRELAPRTPGVVTVGSFHAGTKHNVISDRAHLQLTVRNTSDETRKILLDGIRRIAENIGRAAGLPEDKLPQVIVADGSLPSIVNDRELMTRVSNAWSATMAEGRVVAAEPSSMVAEDFVHFTRDPEIPGFYWAIGGTPRETLAAEAAGGPAVAGQHSALFRIEPKPTIVTGVESTVLALMELLRKDPL
ncbi:MAG: amidohydrolase [Woeseiaceae bacterium]|nr:amidohydrolase [Woeseiaceae bacterium]